MPKCRKLPIVLNFCVWTGNQEEAANFLGKDFMGVYPETGEIIVDSLEGPVRGGIGCSLMEGIEGEHYICEKNIFAKTYEIVEE